MPARTDTLTLPSSQEARSAVLKRLRRAQGQLGGVIAMIDEERSCDEVITQLAAVTKAVNTAAFTLLGAGLHECLTDPVDSDAAATLQRLLLSLA